MTATSVGKEVISYCLKCKTVHPHIIATMKNDINIGKVVCNSCKTTHAYKDPSKIRAKGVSKLRTSKTKARSEASMADIWMNAVNNTTAKSKDYSIKGKFLLGDIIDHPTFGPGVIDKLVDTDKIQVIFRHDIKTLVHNKQA